MEMDLFESAWWIIVLRPYLKQNTQTICLWLISVNFQKSKMAYNPSNIC